ncbi:MAG: glycosyltransferase family 4 protein [Polyangiaceae bacterium]|nr:glycosyltransferase family 4 protein [Polyangiaceae bacterium]
MLFVSKPIVAPFHDGTKCFVRDVATRLERVEPIVMAHPGAPPLPGREDIRRVNVYPDRGSFTPRLQDNARAAIWLLLASRADVWHFVFAPNERTSRIARVLSRSRRVPTLQTVASPPRDFSRAERLLFGDCVVAQSRWTAEQLTRALGPRGRRRPIEVIPPPVAEIEPRSPEACAALRAQLGIDPRATVFVYPGDLEFSSGAQLVADAVRGLVERNPAAVVVFAYRAKTPAAAEVAARLEAELAGLPVRFAASLADVLVLISTAEAVLFPVDDLYGKVDHPIVLLEAMQLGVPVITLDSGPLMDLGGVEKIPLADAGLLVEAACGVAANPDRRARIVAAQRAAIAERHHADIVAARYEALYLELLGGRRA